MLKIENTIVPHTGETILYLGAELKNAKKAMIMIHGRGADAQSMSGLYEHFMHPDIIYVIPQATGFTWYPYRFIEARESNEPGISSALTLINAIITALNNLGIATSDIFLLGFSQGACLALDYSARYPEKYAGIFCLSGGLIGKAITPDDYSGDMKQTTVFLGCSESDFHIPEERVHQSSGIMKSLNADVTNRIYPNLGHTINRDELEFITSVLNKS